MEHQNSWMYMYMCEEIYKGRYVHYRTELHPGSCMQLTKRQMQYSVKYNNRFRLWIEVQDSGSPLGQWWTLYRGRQGNNLLHTPVTSPLIDHISVHWATISCTLTSLHLAVRLVLGYLKRFVALWYSSTDLSEKVYYYRTTLFPGLKLYNWLKDIESDLSSIIHVNVCVYTCDHSGFII